MLLPDRLVARPLHDGESNNDFQSLQSHLDKVTVLCRKYCTVSWLQDISAILGKYHDAGKAREMWRAQFDQNTNFRNSCKKLDHSSYGGILLLESELPDALKEFMAEIIWSHHGLRNCIRQKENSYETDRDFKDRTVDMTGFDEEVLQTLRKELQHDVRSIKTEDLKKFEKFSEQSLQYKGKSVRFIQEELSFQRGMLYRYLLSVLIDADWTDSSNVGTDYDPDSMGIIPDWESLQLVFEDFYRVKAKCDSPLNKVRSQIADQCLESAKNSEDWLYCLDTPTGSGKTLSSMRFALEKAKEKGASHIIYAAPYNSILDQNARVFEEIFPREEILIHYSGADWVTGLDTDFSGFEDQEQKELNEKYRVYAENWSDVPIILTSCKKLLDSLFSGKSSVIRRMHSLANTVILIDEIQDLPMRLRYCMTLALRFLGETLNSVIVLCTATQPEYHTLEKFAVRSTPAVSLVQLSESQKKVFHRTVIELVDECREITEIQLAEHVLKNMSDPNIRSVLVVTNTAKASNRLYMILKQMVEAQNQDIEIVGLSRKLYPELVNSRIEEISQAVHSGKKMIVCATKMIQAGVDLSFDCVYRSKAGMDDVVQSDGRNHRHGEPGTGITWIFHLKDDQLSDPSGEFQMRLDAFDSILHKHQNEEADQWFESELLSYFNRLQKAGEKKTGRGIVFEYPDFISSDTGKKKSSLLSELSIPLEAYPVLRSKKELLQNEPFLVQRFVKAAEIYRYIDDSGHDIVIFTREVKELVEQIGREPDQERRKKLVRHLNRYIIHVYDYEKDILDSVVIRLPQLQNLNFLFLDEEYFHPHLGIQYEKIRKVQAEKRRRFSECE